MGAGKGVLQLFSHGVKLVPLNLWKPLKAHISDETFRSRWPQVLKLILPLVLHTIYFLSTFQDLTCFSHFLMRCVLFVVCLTSCSSLCFTWSMVKMQLIIAGEFDSIPWARIGTYRSKHTEKAHDWNERKILVTLTLRMWLNVHRSLSLKKSEF